MAHLPPVRDIQVTKDKESLAQLYEKSYENTEKTAVYSAVPITPDMVERLIRDKPINMLGMLQSLWTLFHEKELLLSAKKNVKKLREPLIRIINLLSFAYQSSIITPEDDEEADNEEERIKRNIAKRHIRSLNHPTILASALTSPEEIELANFLSRTVDKLTLKRKKIILDEDSDDGDNDDNMNLESPVLEEMSQIDNADDDDDDDEILAQDPVNKNPSINSKFVKTSTAAVADALSRTDPTSAITVEQVMNMHMEAMGTFKDVIKMGGQVRTQKFENLPELNLQQ